MIIVILGILAAIAIPRYIDLTSDAKSAAEKGVVGGVRSGIMTYYAENKAWPSALDSATDGTASSSNLFFSNVLSQGVDDSNWSKSGSAYTGPAGNTYTYDSSTGTFQ
jgi:type II secretory pathway pseudopilin PulG